MTTQDNNTPTEPGLWWGRYKCDRDESPLRVWRRTDGELYSGIHPDRPVHIDQLIWKGGRCLREHDVHETQAAMTSDLISYVQRLEAAAQCCSTTTGAGLAQSSTGLGAAASIREILRNHGFEVPDAVTYASTTEAVEALAKLVTT